MARMMLRGISLRIDTPRTVLRQGLSRASRQHDPGRLRLLSQSRTVDPSLEYQRDEPAT
jgi:hypothetical protein